MEQKKIKITWPLQLLRGLLTGALVGLLMTIFALSINIAGKINSTYPILVFLIPVGAVLTTYIYKKAGPKYRNSTTEAIDDINNANRNLAKSQVQDSVCPQMGFIAYIATLITHITGASGGKEGSGVQIGLAGASAINSLETKLLKNESEHNSEYYLMCGASAAFGALFSSPIAGVMFGTQFASPKTTRLDAWLPCTISSFTAVIVSKLLNIHILHIPTIIPLETSISNYIIVALFAVIVGYYSRLFCFFTHSVKHLCQSKIKNEYLKVAFPATILLILSIATYFLTGTFMYNGLGGSLLSDIISGKAPQIADVMKLLMVTFTFAAGFAGGEVVPLLIVGAGFGMSFASIFSLPVSSFAALGALSMLSGGTNLPLACFALGLELFGYSEPTLLFLATSLSFLASGTSGIYNHQTKPY